MTFSPNDALALYGKAITLQELGRHEGAVKVYEQVVLVNPKHSKAYVGWAECLEALGHREALSGVLKQGIEVASQRGDLQPLARLKEMSKNSAF